MPVTQTGNIFSHPAFVVGDSTYNVVGYNLQKSIGNANSPNRYGPWIAVPGYSGYTSNLALYDSAGSYWDLYQVQPILQIAGNSSAPLILQPWSRPFYAWTPLYDSQINTLLETFRRNWVDDKGIRSSDSTVATESTGAGAAPFITDANTARFYLSFLPNAKPAKFLTEDVVVFNGSTEAASTALTPYVDYWPDIDGGFIDFKTNPSSNSYLKVEYTQVEYTQDDCRNMLVNAVSDLGNYGITDYNVANSWNLYYVGVNGALTAVLNRDLANIVCAIAQRTLLGSQIQSSFKSAEAWKDGKVEYTADPSRSIQAGTLWHTNLGDTIQRMVNNYIINTRVYFSRGEYDSFFDTSGILPIYNSYFNTFNYFSWWL